MEKLTELVGGGLLTGLTQSSLNSTIGFQIKVVSPRRRKNLGREGGSATNGATQSSFIRYFNVWLGVNYDSPIDHRPYLLVLGKTE